MLWWVIRCKVSILLLLHGLIKSALHSNGIHTYFMLSDLAAVDQLDAFLLELYE
jgi:hypothetical protein